MPRRSAASLAIVTPDLSRPKAPAELTKDEAVVWEEVVSTKPADWFTRDTHPLLVAYCRATVVSRVIAKQVDAFNQEWLVQDGGLARYEKLVRMQRSQSTLLATLATKMRISQQSKYGARGANSHAKAGAAPKPWLEPKTAAR
jgi:hypothetical protein